MQNLKNEILSIGLISAFAEIVVIILFAFGTVDKYALLYPIWFCWTTIISVTILSLFFRQK